MTSAHALQSARAVGIRVRIDGDDLELQAPAQPPHEVLELLSLHKTDILRLLRPTNDGWSPEDWQVFFEERAAILEFDGRVPRAEAELRAFAYCLTEWINRNPTPSPPAGADPAAVGNDLAIRYYPWGQTRPAMPGCIARACRNGMGRVKPEPSPHSIQWGSEHKDSVMSLKRQRLAMNRNERKE